MISNSSLLQVVNVEPDVNRTVLRHNFGDVALQKLLQPNWHIAWARAAKLVVPCNNLGTVFDFGMLLQPSSNFRITRAGGDKRLELLRTNPGETKELIIERTIEVILTCC
jgi:hypothetical protein